MEIIGIALKKGEYEGRPYNKVKLHCKGTFDDLGSAVGESVELYSLNYDDCENLFRSCEGNLQNLIGVNVEVSYNRYGKPQKALILE